jgi:3-hydroxy-3-methylglutaryl CoA synthase
MPYDLQDAEDLHEEPKVEEWYRDLLETTGVRPEEYLDGLHQFSRHTNTHPEELLRMAAESRKKLIERFRKDQEARGRDVRTSLAAVHSWIEHKKAGLA